MGIFNLFKKKKNNNLELLKWQNIIQHKECDKLLMSKSKLTSYTLNVYLPNILRIIDDCVNLVNDTKNPNVFFPRFNELIKYLNELSTLEKFIDFNAPLPSTQLAEVLSHKEIIDKQFIDRYFENILEAANKLKTEKGRKNRLNKKINDLLTHKKFLSTNNLEYIVTLLNNNNIDVEIPSNPFPENTDIDKVVEELKSWSNGEPNEKLDKWYKHYYKNS